MADGDDNPTLGNLIDEALDNDAHAVEFIADDDGATTGVAITYVRPGGIVIVDRAEA